MRIVHMPTTTHWSVPPRRKVRTEVLPRLLALLRLLAQACGRAGGVVREWHRRSRDRAKLAMLDDRMLRDIGVSRADVWYECNKPFWRE
jgi:uncharacterized protein YjiS (DUF1127 family)